MIAYLIPACMTAIAAYLALRLHRKNQQADALLRRAFFVPAYCVCDDWPDEEPEDDYQLAEGEHQYEEVSA